MNIVVTIHVYSTACHTINECVSTMHAQEKKEVETLSESDTHKDTIGM